MKNNTEGDADAAIRERFEEPSWNNPVVRVFDPAGEELIPRLHARADWTAEAVLFGMARALGDDAPAWLNLAAQERRAHRRGLETAIFGMA